MKPIRTYEVHVEGFPPAKYSARSPGKARARAWRDFTAVYDATFKRFMQISRVVRIPDLPGCGERIVVSGKTVTRVYHPLMGGRGAVWFMPDDSDVVLCSHPSDVAPVTQPVKDAA